MMRVPTSRKIGKGSDVTHRNWNHGVRCALEAAEELVGEGVDTVTIAPIKPIDETAIINAARGTD